MVAFNVSLISAVVLATVEAAKVFPYSREWEFKSIPSGSLGVTPGYYQYTTLEVSTIDVKAPTYFNVYLTTVPASGSFVAENVYQNFVTFTKMSENELDNFVDCKTANPKTISASTPVTTTMTNYCGSGDIKSAVLPKAGDKSSVPPKRELASA